MFSNIAHFIKTRALLYCSTTDYDGCIVVINVAEDTRPSMHVIVIQRSLCAVETSKHSVGFIQHTAHGRDGILRSIIMQLESATSDHNMVYLYTMRTQARRGTSLHVGRQILVHIFEHKEQYKLLFLFQLPAMPVIKQSARKQSTILKKRAIVKLSSKALTRMILNLLI
jgi:hypothetical protein